MLRVTGLTLRLCSEKEVACAPLAVRTSLLNRFMITQLIAFDGESASGLLGLSSSLVHRKNYTSPLRLRARLMFVAASVGNMVGTLDSCVLWTT